MTYTKIYPPIIYTTDNHPDPVLTSARDHAQACLRMMADIDAHLTETAIAHLGRNYLDLRGIKKTVSTLITLSSRMRAHALVASRPDAPDYVPAPTDYTPDEARSYGGVRASRLCRARQSLQDIYKTSGIRAALRRFWRVPERLVRGLSIQSRVVKLMQGLIQTLEQGPVQTTLRPQPVRHHQPTGRASFTYDVPPHAVYAWAYQVGQLGYDPRHTSIYWLERQAKAIGRAHRVGPELQEGASKVIPKRPGTDDPIEIRTYTPPEGALHFDEIWPPIDLERFVRERRAAQHSQVRADEQAEIDAMAEVDLETLEAFCAALDRELDQEAPPEPKSQIWAPIPRNTHKFMTGTALTTALTTALATGGIKFELPPHDPG